MQNMLKTQTKSTTKPIKKYSYKELAECFTKLAKEHEISSISIDGDICKLKQDVKKILLWKIDERFSIVSGIGDLNKALTRIMLYSQKTEPKQNIVKNWDKLENIVKELEKKIDILQKSLLNKTDDENIQAEIKTKTAMIEKINSDIDNQKTKERNKLSVEQIGSVAKKIHEIMINKETSSIMFEELEYASLPKVDRVKEAMGGDYVLANAERDYKYKNTGNEKAFGKIEQNTTQSTIIAPSNKVKKYVPPSIENVENLTKSSETAQDNKTIKKYVPPTLDNIISDTIKDIDKYSPPTGKPDEINNATAKHEKAKFIKIDEIADTFNIESNYEFPSLGNSNETITNIQSDIVEPNQPVLCITSDSDDDNNTVIDMWDSNKKEKCDTVKKEETTSSNSKINFKKIVENSTKVPTKKTEKNKSTTSSQNIVDDNVIDDENDDYDDDDDYYETDIYDNDIIDNHNKIYEDEYNNEYDEDDYDAWGNCDNTMYYIDINEN